MKVACALASGAARLRAAGVADPATDTRRLMALALGIGADRLTLHMQDALGGEAAALFEAALKARVSRRPMSQITGWRDFWRARFRVTSDVLDPRPETEVLVAAALEAPFARVLDLGTGSGCILLSLLLERPDATGLGVDSSQAALTVARANAAGLGLDARADFALGDWCAGVEGPFDLIVSNPPYIAEAEIPALAPEVRDWEPRAALTPGGDGLDAYRAIAAGAPGLMADGARLLVEIGPTQAGPVAAILRAAGLCEIAVVTDLDARPRVVTCRR